LILFFPSLSLSFFRVFVFFRFASAHALARFAQKTHVHRHPAAKSAHTPPDLTLFFFSSFVCSFARRCRHRCVRFGLVRFFFFFFVRLFVRSRFVRFVRSFVLFCRARVHRTEKKEEGRKEGRGKDKQKKVKRNVKRETRNEYETRQKNKTKSAHKTRRQCAQSAPLAATVFFCRSLSSLLSSSSPSLLLLFFSFLLRRRSSFVAARETTKQTKTKRERY